MIMGMSADLSYYTAIVSIMSLLLLVMIAGTFNNFLISRKNLLCFHGLFVLLIILNWTEWVSVYLRTMGTSDLVWLHHIVRFIEFTLTPCLPILATYIFLKPKKIVLLPAVINLVLQIVAAFTPFIYTIDHATNAYARTWGYAIYVVLFSIPAIVMFWSCAKFSKKYQHKNIVLLVLIMVMTLSALGVSFLSSNLKLDWSIISLATVVFYIYIIQMVLQTDPLTTLSNRQSFDYATANIKRPATIVVIDIDHFKKINDSFGHAYGDFCLRHISNEIKSVFQGKAISYRYGGDEIVVISKKPIPNIEELVNDMYKKVAKIETGENITFSVSAGYANFDPKTCTIQDTLKSADDMMYNIKTTKNFQIEPTNK